MTKKQSYWLSDGFGAKALVEGAEQKDRWVPLGWSESDEPAGDDRVWLRHEEHGGRALFPAAAMELWQQKGWQPSDPPEPVSPFNAPQPAADVSEAPVAAISSPASAGKASNTSKEQ
ncbi:hypothetical protein [Micromonospora aurantiaca (nom. illeg.)]|uniref:hypothetical protein n=1 Tax=Micromonospora aurantiaca (nom. illeg.) TaxID=47850 RepID=UPI003EBD3CB4